MARTAREKSKTGIYHIIIRGINRQSIFEDIEDKEKFIQIIERYKTISEYRVYAYCLMDNHIHMLMKEEKEPIGMTIKRISSSYVSWYNAKYKRCGHLFQERFKSEAVETESYFLTVLRYIHQNPIQAKVRTDISDYRWSSYREYLNKQVIIDSEIVLKMFSEEPEEAIKRFIKYSNETSTDKCLEIEEAIASVTDDELRAIIKSRYNINAIEIMNESREQQNSILKNLKAIAGVNIRQISRITGLSQTRVWKA